MKTILYLIGLSLIALVSCKSEPLDNGDNQEIARLRNQIRQLELDQSEKDALIDESLMVFSEIQENVARIQNKEQEIRITASEPGNGNSKDWVLQELKNIQFLREENSRKINALNKQISGKEAQIGQLHQMIVSLQEQIASQEALIQALQVSFSNQDSDYSKLLDAYMEQTHIADAQKKELNTAYYVYGTLKELKENNVVVQKKGFIGLGKRSSLKENFNEDYFTAINKFEKNNIQIIGNKIKIISDHPSSSYEIVENGKNKVLKIKQPIEFWKISKYLVIQVE
jgi:chromosome segregation ATPase